jgi:hypothetical protein
VREFITIGLKDKIARLSPEHRLHGLMRRKADATGPSF